MELLDDRAAVLDVLLLALAVVGALSLEGPRQADIFPRVLWALHDVVPDHRIDREMPLMLQEHSLQMEWCLDCHRSPERFVRPRSEIFAMGYRPSVPQSEIGPRLVREYGIQSLTNCSTCHR
jgi:hypothetical protein